MSFSIQYKTLFKVDIFHLFFLNDGAKTWFSMTATENSKQLDGYEVNSFLDLAPTNETQQKLKGYNLVFSNLNTGFALWSKVDESNNTLPFIPLPDDLYFTFLIKIKDPIFYNYTDIELNNLRRINYFSNRRLSTESPGFPLINQSGDHFSINGTFALSPESATEEYKNLSSSEKINLFGLIKIYIKGANPTLNIITPLGKIADPPKTFELVFDNRKTFWRYIFRESQKVKPKDDVKIEGADSKVLVTKLKQPLTKKGFISLELGGIDLPNPGAQLIKPDILNTKYYSEIYM
jgi:hypothetical protein